MDPEAILRVCPAMKHFPSHEVLLSAHDLTTEFEATQMALS
jgi:hypothetical protein